MRTPVDVGGAVGTTRVDAIVVAVTNTVAAVTSGRGGGVGV